MAVRPEREDWDGLTTVGTVLQETIAITQHNIAPEDMEQDTGNPYLQSAP